MDPSWIPDVYFPVENPLAITLNLDSTTSNWINPNTYRMSFNVDSALNTLINIDVNSSPSRDTAGNIGTGLLTPNLFSIIINTGIGVGERSFGDLMIFYPNPVHTGETARLIVPRAENDWVILVWDARGSEVARLQGTAGKDAIDVPTNEFEPGLYFLQYKCGQFGGTLPFVIDH